MAYTTLADVRALSKLSDSGVYTDDEITEGIAWAELLVNEYTGTSYEAASHSLTLDGTGTDTLFVGVPHLISVTSCAVDGVAVADVSGWVVRPGGVVRRDSGSFTASPLGMNVDIVVSAGEAVSAPADIAWAAKTLARWYVLRLNSEAPDNAISITTAGGDFRLNAQPGKYGPTALPEVNAVLMRYRTRPPAAF